MSKQTIHPDNQVGLRSKTIDKIEKLTDTKEHTVRKKKLSSKQVQVIYETLLNSKAQPMNGRAWHIQQLTKKLNLEIRKELKRNDVRIPLTALNKLQHRLQQQQS